MESRESDKANYVTYENHQGRGRWRGKAQWFDTKCFLCNAPIHKLVSSIRGRRDFCCRSHYYQAIKNPNYRRDTLNGNYLARQTVRAHFKLQRGNVVHHKDGDCLNNALSNLAVFASQAEHISFHRGGPCKPLWDGAVPEQYLPISLTAESKSIRQERVP